MSREDFEGIAALAKQCHIERVAKTPSRIAYAVKQFEKQGIKFNLKNAATGHFCCYRKFDNKLFQFWAGTGKILGEENSRGIHSLIKMLEENPKGL